jgi:hypothetical protein
VGLDAVPAIDTVFFLCKTAEAEGRENPARRVQPCALGPKAVVRIYSDRVLAHEVACKFTTSFGGAMKCPSSVSVSLGSRRRNSAGYAVSAQKIRVLYAMLPIEATFSDSVGARSSDFDSSESV